MKTLMTATLALALLGGTAAGAEPARQSTFNHASTVQNYLLDVQFRDRAWRRGMMFRDYNRFMVNDWRRVGLRRPGRGLFWVRSGNTFLLVNRRGVVIDVVARPRGFRRF